MIMAELQKWNMYILTGLYLYVVSTISNSILDAAVLFYYNDPPEDGED